MEIPNPTTIRSLMVNGALRTICFAAFWLLSASLADAGGPTPSGLVNTPYARAKQRTDQLVAITRAGYYTARFSTTPKTKVAFASRDRVADSPCLSTCQKAVVVYSDLTAIVYARPLPVYGSSAFTVVVDVVELNSVQGSGSFRVNVTKDKTLSLSLDPSLTLVNNKSVQNSVWSFDNSNPNYYILTTSQSVPAGDKLSFGLTGMLNPGASTGALTISSTVITSTLIEAKATNNIDADKVEYFQQ